MQTSSACKKWMRRRSSPTSSLSCSMQARPCPNHFIMQDAADLKFHTLKQTDDLHYR